MKPEWEARFVHQLCRIKGQASLRYNLSAQIVGSFILFIKQGRCVTEREGDRERGQPTVLATMFCSTVAHTANRGRRCNVATSQHRNVACCMSMSGPAPPYVAPPSRLQLAAISCVNLALSAIEASPSNQSRHGAAAVAACGSPAPPSGCFECLQHFKSATTAATSNQSSSASTSSLSSSSSSSCPELLQLQRIVNY